MSADGAGVVAGTALCPRGEPGRDAFRAHDVVAWQHHRAFDGAVFRGCGAVVFHADEASLVSLLQDAPADVTELGEKFFGHGGWVVGWVKWLWDPAFEKLVSG